MAWELRMCLYILKRNKMEMYDSQHLKYFPSDPLEKCLFSNTQVSL